MALYPLGSFLLAQSLHRFVASLLKLVVEAELLQGNLQHDDED